MQKLNFLKMSIFVYNTYKEDHHYHPNNYYIGRPSILGNPYSHLPEEETLAVYKCNSREEAIEKYSSYFDLMYGSNLEFTKIIDEIYEKYKQGEDIYFECFCHPEPCHGDVISKKLSGRLLKEKMQEMKKMFRNDT